MKVYGGMDVWIPISLTLALAGGEWSASCPCCFTPEKEPLVPIELGGWVGPRASLDNVEKRKFLFLLGLELQPLGHPAYYTILAP
jgi:hypothetical protein